MSLDFAKEISTDLDSSRIVIQQAYATIREENFGPTSKNLKVHEFSLLRNPYHYGKDESRSNMRNVWVVSCISKATSGATNHVTEGEGVAKNQKYLQSKT